MKLTHIFAAAALVLMTASCGVLGAGCTSGASVGVTGGQASGAAVKNLYAQYQADGKIDVTNINNVVNLATLANGIQGLKDQDDKSAFYADFAKGLVLGSGNLISNTAAPSVTNSLTGLANTDLSALTNAASAVIGSGLGGSVQSGSQNVAQSATQSTGQSVTSAITSLVSDSNVSSAVSTVSSILGLLGK